VQEASPDEDQLNFTNLILAEILNEGGARPRAKARAAPDRNDVDDPVPTIYKDDLVFHDEEAVVAVAREDINQDRERRHRHDVHVTRHNRAGADREVDAVDARHVPCRKDRLLDRGLLLRADLHTGPRPDAGARLLRRALALCRSAGRLVLLRLSLAVRRTLTGRRPLALALRGLAGGRAFTLLGRADLFPGRLAGGHLFTGLA